MSSFFPISWRSICFLSFCMLPPPEPGVYCQVSSSLLCSLPLISIDLLSISLVGCGFLSTAYRMGTSLPTIGPYGPNSKVCSRGRRDVLDIWQKKISATKQNSNWISHTADCTLLQTTPQVNIHLRWQRMGLRRLRGRLRPVSGRFPAIANHSCLSPISSFRAYRNGLWCEQERQSISPAYGRRWTTPLSTNTKETGLFWFS